jgi:hypothetical protein
LPIFWFDDHWCVPVVGVCHSCPYLLARSLVFTDVLALEVQLKVQPYRFIGRKSRPYSSETAYCYR